ncbi:MAG: hypothetical protein HKP14_06730 [Bacteroidia bacterium]|nr:hypothetical protein [Bacteroidia bacterium]
MTTSQRVINSYGAAVYSKERELQKRAQECVKQYNKLQELKQIKNPHEALAAWKSYVTNIQSVHKNCIESVDWDRIQRSRKPREPRKTRTHEFEAQFQLQNYTPSVLDKFSRSIQKKINRLKRNIDLAKIKDREENDLRYGRFLDDLRNWEVLQDIANGIQKNKTVSYNNALQYFKPFDIIQEYGDDIIYSFSENALEIELHVCTEKIIPKYELIQSESGKVYKRMLTTSKMQELYQNHVYSSSLKIAREVFAYLPLKQVIVNTINTNNSILSSTKAQTDFSVSFDSKTIGKLNTDEIETTDDMFHFVDSMQENSSPAFNVALSA